MCLLLGARISVYGKQLLKKNTRKTVYPTRTYGPSKIGNTLENINDVL